MDGKECEKPACKTSKRSFSAMMAHVQGKSQISSEGDGVGCPPDREELGRAGWTMLHSFAAHFPDTPTPQHQAQALALIYSMSKLYPCGVCATDFRHDILSVPPKVTTRRDLCQWMCEQHNRVNTKLGKPEFDCSLSKLDQRWLRSDRKDCQ
eukprot:c8879_g1_i1.p1 GENE.c8879_g1_i1~~c8879_g1_i1.p1  ORF type:complete len:152 (+),score=21.75 c8879_g1_i1:46-501(+)